VIKFSVLYWGRVRDTGPSMVFRSICPQEVIYRENSRTVNNNFRYLPWTFSQLTATRNLLYTSAWI